MPIRSPRGRGAAYRALWQWPLRSPARLAAAVAVALGLAVVVSIGIGTLGGGSTSAMPGGTTGGRAPLPLTAPAVAAPAPTALPPVPELRPSTLPLSQAPEAALQVASRWTAAWLRPDPGVTADEWLSGLRPYTSEEYLGVLAAVDPANVPATTVTGEPQPVRVSPRSVQVEMPTDALTLLLLLVDTEDGWRVAGYEQA